MGQFGDRRTEQVESNANYRNISNLFIRKEELGSKLCKFLKKLLLLIDPVISDNQSLDLVETDRFIQRS